MNELHKAYAVLGLEPGSSMESILRRYKRLIMVWHPDRAPTPEHKEFAEEELKKINNAKDLLTKHFGAGGGHKATGCDCQPEAAPAAGAGARSSSGGSSAGPGPRYHRTKTPDEKYQEEQAAKKRDAERKAREDQEAAAKRAQEEQQKKATQQSMETAMQQQKSLQDEKLRWQISVGLILAFIALEIFGSMAMGVKHWWHDTTWKWQNEHSSTPTNNNTSSNTSTNTGADTTYIPPEYRFPGGNPTSWKKFMDDEEAKRHQREQKQHDDDIYFTRLEVDKYQKIIEHCNSELANLEIKIADPSVSDYEKQKLIDMRNFRQQNLSEAQANLKVAQDKLTTLTGEAPPQTAPSLTSPIPGTSSGLSLSPLPSNNNLSPLAVPADPNSSTNTGTSLSSSFFKRKFGLDPLSTPSSTSTSRFSELMRKYSLDNRSLPGTTTGADSSH
jgi:curved DNA-binding protein CbpA